MRQAAVKEEASNNVAPSGPVFLLLGFRAGRSTPPRTLSLSDQIVISYAKIALFLCNYAFLDPFNMEAVVALGAAGNTVQFLDFAIKLCATSIEIYRDAGGASAANAQSETLLKSFINTLDEVSADLDQYFNALGTASTQAQKQGDTHITFVIADCQSIVKDLTQRFDKLRASGKPGRWRSFRSGIKCVWGKNELEELQKRLRKNRDELEWRVMLSLREGMNLLASRQEDQFRDLQVAITTKLADILRDQISALPKWPESIERTIEQLRVDVITAAKSRFQQPEQSAIRTLEPTTASLPRHEIRSFADTYAKECAAKLSEIEEERWKSLAFPVMDDREDQIAEAELETFDWVLQPPKPQQRAWSSFTEWLESEDSLYWISGKAGSGKSTMMKYLNTHHRVQEALKGWAADTPLITASFYFWHNGNALQRTQEGLLRALLYQTLRDHRELIPMVLKESFDVSSTDLADFWTLRHLKNAFRRLIEQDEVSFKICFLIDGLDEYAGDHAEIVDVFQHAAKHRHVKICVSSRPLLVFDRAFGKYPGLMLQNLTFDDIETYVKRRFHNDKRFQELENEEPGLGPSLASQVVTKASGVFLWVKLVVYSLLEGIQNYDQGIDLERRLNELPEDLNELYLHMLDRVRPTWYLEEGFKLLLLVRAAIQPLTLRRLTFIELGCTVVHNDLKNLSIKRQNALCKSMAGRVKSRCLGLLEVVDGVGTSGNSAHLQFLHKTVADFIDTPEMKSRMQICLGEQEVFHPEIAIMEGIHVELKTIWSRLNDRQIGEQGELKREAWFDEVRPLRDAALEYAKQSYGKDPDATTSIMENIDQTTTELWESVSFRSLDEISGETDWSVAPRKPAAATYENDAEPMDHPESTATGNSIGSFENLKEALRHINIFPPTPADSEDDEP